MNNVERRDNELPYKPDIEIARQLERARGLLEKLNNTSHTDLNEIRRIEKELLGKSQNLLINPPFHCDFGFNIEVGDGFFANFNCTFLDSGKIVIGDNCLLGPNVSIYTSGHPIHPDSRKGCPVYAIGVTIGDNCWIGGNTVICPGVHIGNNVVIGAGSVVTKDIPDWTVAVGNPCRVIRKITDDDRKYYYKDRQFDEEAWQDIVEQGLAGN